MCCNASKGFEGIVNLPFHSFDCVSSTFYFSFLCHPSNFLIPNHLPFLTSSIFFLSPLSFTVSSFSLCHEMAAKGLSVWFLLSADPISKGRVDSALAPALLLFCSPALTHHRLKVTRRRETDWESEGELSFILLEDRLIYKIILPPSHSFVLLHTSRKRKKKNPSRPSNASSECLLSFWKAVLPSLWGQLLRTIVGLFRYLLCHCCKSGHVLVWLVDAHQCVHCSDGNNNYHHCLWHEHSLSNVYRWSSDCIAQDMLVLMHKKMNWVLALKCILVALVSFRNMVGCH